MSPSLSSLEGSPMDGAQAQQRRPSCCQAPLPSRSPEGKLPCRPGLLISKENQRSGLREGRQNPPARLVPPLSSDEAQGPTEKQGRCAASRVYRAQQGEPGSVGSEGGGVAPSVTAPPFPSDSSTANESREQTQQGSADHSLPRAKPSQPPLTGWGGAGTQEGRRDWAAAGRRRGAIAGPTLRRRGKMVIGGERAG